MHSTFIQLVRSFTMIIHFVVLVLVFFTHPFILCYFLLSNHLFSLFCSIFIWMCVFSLSSIQFVIPLCSSQSASRPTHSTKHTQHPHNTWCERWRDVRRWRTERHHCRTACAEPERRAEEHHVSKSVTQRRWDTSWRQFCPHCGRHGHTWQSRRWIWEGIRRRKGKQRMKKRKVWRRLIMGRGSKRRCNFCTLGSGVKKIRCWRQKTQKDCVVEAFLLLNKQINQKSKN